MDDLKNLIDWSSPENKSNEANRNQPLIPCPSSAPLINNPFDSICEQLQVTSDDPFEAVLSTAMCYKKAEPSKAANKKQKNISKRKTDDRGSCGDQEKVSTSETISRKDELKNVSPKNIKNVRDETVIDRPRKEEGNEVPLKIVDNSEDGIAINRPISATPYEEEDDDNKENSDPCPPKELGKIKEISFLEGEKRAPLSEISVDKLYVEDESCPSFLVEENNPHEETDDFPTGPPLRTEIEIVAGEETGMKGKCQSATQLYVENDNARKLSANNTFCGGFDGLEGFKPLGELVSSSFCQASDKNNEKDLLSVTCEQMNSRLNFRTASAPSLSTPRREDCLSDNRNNFFSSELSPVLRSAVRGSSSSSTYSFMNRGMRMSDGTDFSFASRKMEYSEVFNNCENEENDDVFVEAKILAQSFSESVHVEDKVDEVADLFSIELNLVHANSSDEENDSLRNDPSLNFNFVSPATKQKNLLEFSEAVKKYKKRRSTDPLFASTDALNESQEETCQKKSASFSETPKSSKNRNCKSPTSITAGLNLLKKQIDSLPIGNNILQVQKSKKDEGGVCSQKGAPLKATVPLQFMIRSNINKDIGIDKKTVAIKPITQSKARAATRMNAQKNAPNPRPVASSTPNKNKSMNTSHGQSLIMDENNRSLDSSDGIDHKKPARSNSLTSIQNSDQSLKSINGKATPTRNGLSVRNSMPIMKQANKKLSTLSKNSPNLGVRNSLLSPSSTSAIRKYGKRSI